MKELKEGTLIITTFPELEQQRGALGINPGIQFLPASRKTSRYESHEGYDLIFLHLPSEFQPNRTNQRISIYFRKDLLVFCFDHLEALNEILGISVFTLESLALEQVLYSFFNKLTEDDNLSLEELDQEITSLEEAFMTAADQRGEEFKMIIQMRKRLLALKLYYDQLVDIAESIEDNENQLISEKTSKHFRILTRRVDRLYRIVVDLQDYLSQVREGYQEQIEISMNKVMKLLTVITVIFLPLSLIASWYGMNLNIPEVQSVYTYPVVILLCLAISSFSIFYFKRHDWF